MISSTQLLIHLTPERTVTFNGYYSLDRIVGGPPELLKWLETQLGLPQADVHRAARVMQYADALDKVIEPCFAQSFATDRWETASDLLHRRDELLMSGWDGKMSQGCPKITADLADAEAAYSKSFSGEYERIAEVSNALDAGQVLPEHKLYLADCVESWPMAWKTVLKKLSLCDSEAFLPKAPDGMALYRAGNVVRGLVESPFDCDLSLRVAQARSETAAVEFLAAAFSKSPKTMAHTIVYCEDDALAVRLDACLRRIGLPTMGATLRTRAHPVLQVLPLALELCWEPVDPQCLLDFLTLPIIPFPRAIASDLARALGKEPGLGSSTWQQTFDELCACSENDTEKPGELKQRLLDWFSGQRSPQGDPISTALVAKQCKKVAKWAIGRASLIWKDADQTLGKPSPSDEQIALALREAATQASLLGGLVELSGKLSGNTITKPQLGRLTEEVMDRGIESKPCQTAEDGPTRVRSLAEINDYYGRLIWLGTTTSDLPPGRWSVKQRREFKLAGIEINDGTAELRSLRAAEARGLSRAKESMLVIRFPQNEEQREHPLWLAIAHKISEFHKPQEWKPFAIEDLIRENKYEAITPFTFSCESVSVQPPQPKRSTWSIPATLLRDRDTTSASELEDRLACPLKWTLRYQASLHPSEIARLPDEFQLRGNFFHKILERVFGNDDDLPAVSDAIRLVGQAFDERLPLDAAPLAQPEKRVESLRLKNELLKATDLFVTTLTAGGYRSVKIEEPPEGKVFGKELKGSIDCLAQADDGREAVIDFKYAGRTKFDKMISEGRSVQLATYAISRKQVTGNFPAVAYLILSDGTIFTPTGGAIAGVKPAHLTKGPSIEQVWNNFSTAITAAESWLTTDDPVPARPIQNPTDWPSGSELVLINPLPTDENQSVCRYCDFTRLCGLEETR